MKRLGSTAITTNSSGVKSGEVRYYPWGTERYTSGTTLTAFGASTPTTYKFTGQRYESSIGLYFYNSRWYDPSAGRFLQADTIVPGAGNPQAYDRYAYTLNNPLRYTDPSGHDYCQSTHADPEECAEIDQNGDGLTDPPAYPTTQPEGLVTGSGDVAYYNISYLQSISGAWWGDDLSAQD